MEAFTTFKGIGIPIDIINCDTDQIIPHATCERIATLRWLVFCGMTRRTRISFLTRRPIATARLLWPISIGAAGRRARRGLCA